MHENEENVNIDDFFCYKNREYLVNESGEKEKEET